jgi:NADPH:quinone reductase
MLSMIVDRDGGGLAMRLAELPDPACPPGCVVVAVEAAGVNPVDVGNAADSSWAMVDNPYVVGYEFAGSVAANGATSEATPTGVRFRPGTPSGDSCQCEAPAGARTARRSPFQRT